MAKTEPELRAEFEKYATRESWGAWLIVAALVAEAYSVWQFHTPDKSSVEAIFLVIANLAIAAGVYAEIHFGRKAESIAASLQQLSDERVAQANERALTAQLELEKFRKPRSLPSWKLPDFERALKPFAGTPYLIRSMLDSEIFRLAEMLQRAFKWSQWVEIELGEPSYGGIASMNEYDGIEIRIDASRRGEWWEAAKAVADVFVSEGIDAEARVMESGTPPTAIHIYIGRKT
ncbi:MAG: hypothetical protein QOJ84_3515 [Bradyrhizobium sp.]|jgi:hypothetical protein|nr:hypothetical protein [Bradyrhizobium sp.]